jgi:hypothetical protein
MITLEILYIQISFKTSPQCQHMHHPHLEELALPFPPHNYQAKEKMEILWSSKGSERSTLSPVFSLNKGVPPAYIVSTESPYLFNSWRLSQRSTKSRSAAKIVAIMQLQR